MEHTIVLLDANYAMYAEQQFDDILQNLIKSMNIYQQNPFALFDIMLMSGEVTKSVSNYALTNNQLSHVYVDICKQLISSLEQVKPARTDFGLALSKALCLIYRHNFQFTQQILFITPQNCIKTPLLLQLTFLLSKLNIKLNILSPVDDEFQKMSAQTKGSFCDLKNQNQFMIQNLIFTGFQKRCLKAEQGRAEKMKCKACDQIVKTEFYICMYCFQCFCGCGQCSCKAE
ncbi:von_Willebrand factor A-like domain superfamily [Hexamita inflata]|uniref:von Willebrand factor A-like domain superfamily n=1 Tax=Hexamita inflata TaxID=28002 RepID=A0AA86UFL3_9EUKA|nr:von Willebrand factor A-like domain superfamily [Hexamita inflata]